MFFTGFLSAVRQPFCFHLLMYDMMPLRKYWLSVCRSTRHGFFSASSAEIAAISSMRLLVVLSSPPLSSFSRSPNVRMAPQPPGPGLPEQAPSVCTTTCGKAELTGRLLHSHARSRLSGGNEACADIRSDPLAAPARPAAR